MSELVRIVNSVEQKTAEHWNLANEVYADCPKDLLERVVVGEDHFIATPAIKAADEDGQLTSSFYSGNTKRTYSDGTKVPHHDGFSPEELAIFTNSFRLARRETRRNGTPGSVYLIVNDNFRYPTLNFDERIGLMTLMDADMVSDTELFIPTILSELSKSIDRAEYEAKRAARRKVGGAIGTLVGVATVSALGYVGYRVVDHYIYADDRAEAAAAADRLVFDRQDVSIDTSAIGLSDVEYVASDPAFFEQHPDIPRPANDDTFAKPRAYEIGSQDCKILQLELSSDDGLKFVTDAPVESVTVAIHADGEVQICNTTPTRKDNDGNRKSTLNATVAIEAAD